ncbi:DUF4476 domain-containing protein [Capnocytophaga sputigena]|jgi:hypothetical protein|uniref:DUF4476 domain-containing protein n=1 Tax=Capnocytophaga sputigena TaxID=1019 RepID=A0A250F555_CAPSP|nr:DUF4476 domain-containing protein [Capnocytophaga sputigena]ATA80272.1 hypothetical protein CGC59_11550 [Capnocytophaga sputigena]
MKKLLLLCLGALASVSWAQEVGSAGRLLQNEYRQNKQARAVIGRGGISVNIDWEYDYNGGYAEVFIRIPERGRFTVSIGDQEITSTTGMYRFFDLTATPQPLSIWQGRTLIYRVTINPSDNTRMVMDFFSRDGLYLLDEISLNNNQPSYHGRQWNDVWNRSYGGYGGAPMMRQSDFNNFFKMYKDETFDKDKLSFFRAQKNIVSFTTEQVGQLMEELSFDDNKLIIAQEAYPNVVDPQNYYQLQNKFTFSSGKKKLSEFLQSVRR